MRRVTLLVILCATAGLIGYDAFVILRHGIDASISQVMYDWSRENQIVAFSLGALMGHLFWPQGGGK